MSELEFELDFCIAANMFLGMSYDKALTEAKEWVAEAHDNELANDPD